VDVVIRASQGDCRREPVRELRPCLVRVFVRAGTGLLRWLARSCRVHPGGGVTVVRPSVYVVVSGHTKGGRAEHVPLFVRVSGSSRDGWCALAVPPTKLMCAVESCQVSACHTSTRRHPQGAGHRVARVGAGCVLSSDHHGWCRRSGASLTSTNSKLLVLERPASRAGPASPFWNSVKSEWSHRGEVVREDRRELFGVGLGLGGGQVGQEVADVGPRDSPRSIRQTVLCSATARTGVATSPRRRLRGQQHAGGQQPEHAATEAADGQSSTSSGVTSSDQRGQCAEQGHDHGRTTPPGDAAAWDTATDARRRPATSSAMPWHHETDTTGGEGQPVQRGGEAGLGAADDRLRGGPDRQPGHREGHGRSSSRARLPGSSRCPGAVIPSCRSRR